jgi:hypothetical protein
LAIIISSIITIDDCPLIIDALILRPPRQIQEPLSCLSEE